MCLYSYAWMYVCMCASTFQLIYLLPSFCLLLMNYNISHMFTHFRSLARSLARPFALFLWLTKTALRHFAQLANTICISHSTHCFYCCCNCYCCCCLWLWLSPTLWKFFIRFIVAVLLIFFLRVAFVFAVAFSSWAGFFFGFNWFNRLAKIFILHNLAFCVLLLLLLVGCFALLMLLLLLALFRCSAARPWRLPTPSHARLPI